MPSTERGNRRVVAGVQARMGSSRLPGKVLADVGGRPLLHVLLDRLSAATSLDGIVVAVPHGPEDHELVEAVTSWGYRVMRGPLHDVLDRYRLVADATDADAIVRVTGDCPLVDPRLVDRVVQVWRDDPELALFAVGPSFPEGADCEIVSVPALRAAAHEATLPSHREHVTLYLKDHPQRFRAECLTRLVAPRGHVRLSVDEQSDLDVVRALVERLGSDPSVGIDEYADAYEADPTLVATNGTIVRNEGAWRSRLADQLVELKETSGMKRGRVLSDAAMRRATAVIPQGTQTLSKGIDQFVTGVTPQVIERASGCHVWDLDGNVYIDYPMALGPILLGHAHPAVNEAVTEQLALGSTFTLPHRLEGEVAERMVEMIPCAEQVRFAKNGSDVMSAAVRLSRAVTGRDRVLASGYHGWHDWYVALIERDRGVPLDVRRLVAKFTFNDIASFDAAFDAGEPPAAVVIELPAEDPVPGFLEHLQSRCRAAGSIFVWDEIVTGFRWAEGGAQAYYGVTPDLAGFGKAMANGLPLSAIVGRRDLMQEFSTVFFSGTFGGEALSLAAAKATIDEVRRGHVVPYLWEHGEMLRHGVHRAIERHGLDVGEVQVRFIGHAPRSVFQFLQNGEPWFALRGLFLQETVRRGVLFGIGGQFVSYAHGKADLNHTVDVIEEVLAICARAIADDAVEQLLVGPAPGVTQKSVRS